MKRFTKFGGIALAVLLVLGISGCPDRVKSEDPALNLKSLSIFSKDAKSGSIEVENAKSEVTANDVVAVFDYGTEKDKPLAVEVTKGTLNVGANTVTLTVKAVAGKYKGWTREITVTRKAASVPSGTPPDLVLKSLSIFSKDAKSGSIEVDYAKSEVTANDVVAVFDYGTEKDKPLAVEVTNGTLNVGANTVTLTVKAVAGKYKGWTKKITVTRKAASTPPSTAPDLVLKSLSIFGQDAKGGSIEVENAKSEVTADDVVAVFDYGTEKDKPLAVEVAKGTLNVGANTVTLTVKAVAGKYKGWTKEITVTRKAASVPPSAAPDLVLKSLSIFGQDAKGGSIEVENAKSEVTADDVVAVFDYGTEKDKPLAVEVAKGTLNVGANTVTLTVKAVAGKYKGWTKEITVTRKAASVPPSAAPDLVLKSLSIFGQDAKGGSIEVENAKSEVTADDVVAKFDYGTVTDEELKVTVANGTLNVGANTVKLSIAAVAGKYKSWTKEITVTRAAANAVTMVQIALPTSGQIVGAEPGVALPGSDDYWKGVFIAGRTVQLSGFEMGESETTYALWKEVYDWATTGAGKDKGYKFAKEGIKGKDGSGDDTQPVTTVSWRDVIVWCNAYTEMTDGKADNCVYLASEGGAVLRDATNATDCDKAFFDQAKKGYRLPTEAEWEYAARSNADGTLNPLNRLSGAEADYNDAEACKKVAWYGANSGNKTHPVKGLATNGQNLYDMSGNVWEWCWDRYDDNVTAGDGGATPVTDPAGAPAGAPLGSFRVLRGGGWGNDAGYCLPGLRSGTAPDDANIGLGFRLCRSRS